MEILVEGQLDYFEDKSWKKRYFVLKYEISSALRYIEIYKDKNWQKQLPRHVVNLHPGYDVKRREEPKKKHCFSVKTTDHVLFLASEDENVINRWMATLEEYNLVKSFCVQPQDTPTMERIEAVFPCHLQIVHSEVRLVSAMDGKLLGLWPFKCIRRYKFVGNSFTIEAGRKAPTGEGVFEFISNECSEIYRVLDTVIRAKAGDTTMRRLASEKLHNQVQQAHQPIRKINSVPVSTPKSTKKEELRYDYANPTVNTNLARHLPPPIPLPNPPEKPLPVTDVTYDTLSPSNESTLDEVDAKFPKQGEKATSDSEYNTLQFANAQPGEIKTSAPQRLPQMAGSPGSYDTLCFSTSPEHILNENELQTTKERDGSYDTLQFGSKTNNLISSENIPTKESGHNDNDLQHSSDSFYDTLDHSALPQSSGSVGSVKSIDSNAYDTLTVSKRPPTGGAGTYDILTVSNRPPSGGVDTYDCLANTRQEVKPPATLDLDNTYDAMQSSKPTTTPVQVSSPEKPTAPVKPPPRKKAPSIPKQLEAPAKKISAGNKPEKPVKISRKNIPSPMKESQEEHAPRSESISEVMQKRLAMSSHVDDDNYASVEHEYTSIDYSKVSQKSPSSDIYAEPDELEARGTVAPKPSKPAKPARNPPKPMKNLLKKALPSPKPKVDRDGNFADELKKKLEIKLKKKVVHQPAAPSQTGEDDIYDEVDNTGATYSEPFDRNEANV